MNTDVVEKAFSEMINERGVHRKLRVEDNYVQQLRYKLKNGIGVSMDTKLKLLQKSGWRQDDKTYNRKDLVSLLNFYKRTSQAAKDQGPEYVIEKWEAKR